MPPIPTRPQMAEQQKDLLPGLVARSRAAAGEGVDDAAEQQGSEEAGRGERYVGKGQRDRKAPLGREQSHHTAVKSQEAHFESASPAARPSVPRQPVRLRRATSYQSRSVR